MMDTQRDGDKAPSGILALIRKQRHFLQEPL